MTSLHPTRTTKRLLAFLLAVVIAMAAVRLVFLRDPAGRDEAGYLIVGHGWTHGSSLYGEYWVDRPPLLIWIMEAAHTLTGLRLLGLLSCALMVLGVARTAHLVRGPRAAAWAGATAALLSTAPWFGVVRTNGEMLSAGFVAWGFALSTQALLRPGRRSWAYAFGAGVLAACAAMVKQTIADPLVYAGVLAIAIAWQQPAQRRRVGAAVAAGAGGVAVTVAVVLAAASVRGTTSSELFDALVTFRADAGEVIRTSATSATTDRLVVLLATWIGSGLALIAALTAWTTLRRREPALLATLAVLAFVSGAAILGGSYWGHYLFQLLPASSLAVGLLVDRIRPGLLVAVAAFVLVGTAGNIGYTIADRPPDGVRAKAVGTWLRQSGQPGDTAVVAYGQANVLSNAEMSSPYPYLWSLPVRTLDPMLDRLAGTLAGPDRPTWFVDWSGIDSWGIQSPVPVEEALGRHYRRVADVCGRTVWLDRDERRTLAVPGACR